MCISTLAALLPMGIAAVHSVTGSFTVSNQLVAWSIIVTHVKSISVPSLLLRSYSPIRSTLSISQGFETMITMSCIVFVLMSFVDLAFMALFYIGSDRMLQAF